MITFKGKNKNEQSNGYHCSNIKSAVSSRALNGEYTGEIILPLSALKDKELKNRIKKDMYIKMGDQLFKIVEHDKTLKNIIIYLVHITDELRDTIPVEAGYKSSGTITATFALDKLKKNTQNLPFTLLNYCTNKAAYEVKHSNTLDNIMGQDGFLESFKCEMLRDNYKITFRDSIGSDRGVKAVYRRNLKGIKVKSSSKDVITKIYPMSRDGIILDPFFSDRAETGKVVERFVEFDVEVREARNFTTESGENVVIPAKTEEDVRRELAEYGKTWFKLTNADIPKLQIDANLILLENTEEYKHLKGLERVSLGDYVTVTENPTDTTAKLRVIKINKDELNNKNISITLSSTDKEFNYKSDAKAIENALKQANKIIQQEKDMLAEEIEMRFQHSSNLIKTALGGHVYKRDGELLIMDTDDPATATKVWRWNLNGLGYSSNGVDGDYRLAMTMDGAINADFITAGVLTGNVIRAGLIKGQYVEINNSTTFADGYNPINKADKTELEAGMKSIKQEFTLKDNQLASEISGVDANNNKKISRLIQTINGLTLMMTGTEETVVTQSPSGDVVVDETKLKSKVPGMIDDLIDKHGKVITRDWTNYKWATAEQDKEEFTAIYNHLYSSPDLMGTAKNNLYNAYRGYTIEHKVLSDYYTNVQNGTLEYNKTQEDYRLREYRMAIKLLVQRIEEAKKYIEEYKNSKIVTQYKADITATKKEFNSEYTKITTQISGVDGKVNKLSTDVSNINQKADSITLRVSKTEGDIRSVNTQISTIKQKADSIELSVGKKVDANKIISSINLSNESVRISASKIHLDGYVTVNKLTTEKYVRAHQLNTTSSDRVGVGVTNVNAGRLSSNTAHTSGSGNRIELENQWLSFYNGSLNKMRMGFFGSSTTIPRITLGAGPGIGEMTKGTDNFKISYPDSNNNYIDFRRGTITLRTNHLDLDPWSQMKWFTTDTNKVHVDRQGADGKTYSNTVRFAFNNNAGFYMNDGGYFTFCRTGAVAHVLYPYGTKTGGTIEVDGKNLGMSPVDSPQVLLEDLYIDEEVSEEGTKIYLNDTFKKTIAFPYAVFCSNNAECVEKNIHYFVVKGNGKTDIKVVGKRIAHEEVYYKEMESVPIPEVELREREINGKVELNSREELDALRTAEKHSEVVNDEH